MTLGDRPIDLLRYQFGEVVNERRKTILGVSFSNGRSTSVDIEPCTLEVALQIAADIEEYGITVAAEKYSPCYHFGDSQKDVVFRHPAHTIERIEIIRRKEWRVVPDETKE